MDESVEPLVIGTIIIILLFIAGLATEYSRTVASNQAIVNAALQTNSFTLTQFVVPRTPRNVTFPWIRDVFNPWNSSLTLFLIYNASLISVVSNVQNGTTKIEPYTSLAVSCNVTALVDLFGETSILVKGINE